MRAVGPIRLRPETALGVEDLGLVGGGFAPIDQRKPIDQSRPRKALGRRFFLQQLVR